MTTARLIWHDYRYFPYERTLAERKARAFFGPNILFEDDAVVVPYSAKTKDALQRLTYFKFSVVPTGNVVPDQTRLEASANLRDADYLPGIKPIPNLRRQCTRYSAHGLHEYRGKFNPQIVRAIGNMIGLKRGSWILDPFCGSGTTLLESAHIGWNCIGLDLNPLGVMIANAKIAAFTSVPAELKRESELLAKRLLKNADGDFSSRDRFANEEYLQLWFPSKVLNQLRRILYGIREICAVQRRDIYRAVLSDICRRVSHQDPGDLRIRRRKSPATDYPAVEIFIDAMQKTISAVTQARDQVEPRPDTVQTAIEADCRTFAPEYQFDAARDKKFDAVITSPPYATALPYMDTQRLSLALLAMMTAKEIRARERKLIGNREISDKERQHSEAQLLQNHAELPSSAHAFCLMLLDLANDESHGFRRRNVPALVYKYLADMALSFRSIKNWTKRGALCAVLVGRNSTTLKSQEITIPTPQLLAEIAASRGWSVEEVLRFETYQRYDLHRENSITHEELILLRH